jgi:hypothetical protein
MTKKKIRELFSTQITDSIDAEIMFLEDMIVDIVEKTAIKNCVEIPKDLEPFIKTTSTIKIKSEIKDLPITKIETEAKFPIKTLDYQYEYDIDKDDDILTLIKTHKKLNDSKKAIISLFDSHLKEYTDFEIFVMFPELASQLKLSTQKDIEMSKIAFQTLMETVNEEKTKVAETVKGGLKCAEILE